MLSVKQIVVCLALVAVMLVAADDLMRQFETTAGDASIVRKGGGVAIIAAAAVGLFYFGRKR